MGFAVVFFLIDQRSRRLVQIPKDVLLKFEEDKGWQLFARDVQEMNLARNRIFSYTAAFRLAFLIQFLFGFWIFVLAFWK